MESLPRTMEDNLAPDHQGAVNTNFLEERAQITEQAKHDVSMSLPAQIEAAMPDDTWFARQQLMKPVLVEQVQWTTADGRNTSIVAFDFPTVLAGIESVASRTLSMYAFYKLAPVVRVQVNATQFHQGQLMLSFDPFNQAAGFDVKVDYAPLLPRADVYYCSGLPNVKIMASEVEPAELLIPFVHPRSFLTSNTTDGFDNLGQVRLQVLNPLKAADGASSSLTVSVWVYAKDASVHVPMNYHTPKMPALAYPTLGELSLSETIGEVGGGLKNVGRMIGNFATGNWGKMLRNGQGLIDNLGNIFGFDYPTRLLSPDKCISPVENMAITVGASRSQRLCIDPNSGYVPDPSVFGSTSDDLDLLRIAKTPMLVAQLKWESSKASQTELFKVPVTPMLCPKNLDALFPIKKTIGSNISYLAFASSLFNFWRGGITFDVEFVATHFHSGRILVAFVPNNDKDSLTYVNASNALPNLTMDIQQTSKLSFTVPFVSATPLKYVPVDASIVDDETFTGFLVFYVMNQLTAASNVSPDIEINVYIRAADDFQLFVPANPGIQYMVPQAAPTEKADPTISGVEIQSNRIKDTSLTPVSQLTLGNGFAPKELRFGESYSLLDLIRRFNYLCRFEVAIDKDNAPFSTPDVRAIHPVSPTLAPVSGAVSSSYAKFDTMLGVLSRIFSVWSGSLRYKDVTNADRMYNICYGVAHYPTFVKDLSKIKYYPQGYAFTLTNLSQDNSFEFEVPYYSVYQCLLTKYGPKFQREALRVCLNGSIVSYAFSDKPRNLSEISVYRFVAGGDDFRFAYLRPPGADYTVEGSERIYRHSYTL